MSSKCFVITGASSGLGKALKNYLISETTHYVVSLSRSPEPEDSTNSRVQFFKCDLNELEDLSFIDLIYQCYSHKELVFVNNAAVILPLQAIGTFTPSDLLKHFSINVISPIQLINKFVSLFGQSKLSIVNISSGAAGRPLSHWSLYCTSKAALHMFCNTLALDHPSIAVYNTDPGVMNTNMQRQIRESSIPDLTTFVKLVDTNQFKKSTDVAKEILRNLI